MQTAQFYKDIKYRINFLWLNKAPTPEKPFIKTTSPEKEKETLLLPAIQFAKLNPQATIRIWYDEKFSTPAAISETSSLLEEIKLTDGIPNIELIPIQKLAIVKENPFIFSQYTPVYLRVDLLKCIFLVEDAEDTEARQYYSISCDLDLLSRVHNPFIPTPEALFNRNSLALLHEGGLLMSASSTARVENKFMQLYCHDKQMVTALKMLPINLCMFRTVHILKERGVHYLPNTTQAVFTTLINQLHYIYRYIKNGDAFTIDGRPFQLTEDILGSCKSFGMELTLDGVAIGNDSDIEFFSEHKKK